MALDSWMYLDPEKVAVRKEEIKARKHRQCGPCKHHITAQVDGETLHACEYGRTYGYKCQAFKPRKS
jgi:hypothetical protein